MAFLLACHTWRRMLTHYPINPSYFRSSKTVLTVTEALAYCAPPLPGKEIKPLFPSPSFKKKKRHSQCRKMFSNPLISLEKEMATHSSILAWRIPWIEEPGGLQSLGLWRVGHDWVTNTHNPLISSHANKCLKGPIFHNPFFPSSQNSFF